MTKFKTIKTILFYAALMVGMAYLAPMASFHINQSTEAMEQITGQ